MNIPRAYESDELLQLITNCVHGLKLFCTIGGQSCVTNTNFTLIIDNHKHICVHDCSPIVQKSLRFCTQLVISCNNSLLSYSLGMFIEHSQMCSLSIQRMFFYLGIFWEHSDELHNFFQRILFE